MKQQINNWTASCTSDKTTVAKPVQEILVPLASAANLDVTTDVAISRLGHAMMYWV